MGVYPDTSMKLINSMFSSYELLPKNIDEYFNKTKEEDPEGKFKWFREWILTRSHYEKGINSENNRGPRFLPKKSTKCLPDHYVKEKNEFFRKVETLWKDVMKDFNKKVKKSFNIDLDSISSDLFPNKMSFFNKGGHSRKKDSSKINCLFNFEVNEKKKFFFENRGE